MSPNRSPEIHRHPWATVTIEMKAVPLKWKFLVTTMLMSIQRMY
jgi:hypothetical protein